MRRIRTCIGAAMMLWPVAAHAQSTSSAQALFDEGRKLMVDGKYAEACPKLAASQRLDPGAGTLMNLATCYEKNGQLASAWATFKEAAAAARQSGHGEWETAARDRAANLEPTLSRLTIVVPPEADVPGLVVERDGHAVDRAEWGVSIPVDSGVHPIEATAPKKQKWSTTVSVGPNGAQASVTVPALGVEQSDGATPAASGAVATTPPPADAGEHTGSTQRLLGGVAAGVGVVGIGVGSIFGLMAKSTHDDALKHCTADRRCDREGIDLGDKASSQATVSTVMFVAGGVLLAGGAALYFTAPRAHAAPATALWIAPSIGGAAAGLGGAF